jgi:hypothetical protein
MVVVVELFHYVLRQIIEAVHPLSEDDSFSNFKQLLLRHAVYRPPHSCAILTLEEVKQINLYALDTLYRHYDMYRFAMTPKEELEMGPVTVFHHQEKEPALPQVSAGQAIKFSEVPDLMEYLSPEEVEAVKAEQEYMTNGPGKIEAIINAEMERLQSHMSDKIKE